MLAQVRRVFCLLVLLLPAVVGAQGLAGALIGTVKDPRGGALEGARVRVGSPALIGGSVTTTSDQAGRLRFPALPPGVYSLDIELPGFAAYHEERIDIGAGATIERFATLQLAGLASSVVVEASGSQIDPRDPGFGSRVRLDELEAMPTRRASMFDSIRAAPGVSPTSPSSGTVTTVSAFGSGTNENQFLFDGTNFTCPCNGVARAEPGVDFIQEVHVQSAGASAEFGNVQGAVINVVTKQGSDRFLFESSYFGQTAALTSEPVSRPLAAPGVGQSSYHRSQYRDATATLGGPAVRDRVWFFAGYQYLRDYDSQPGVDPASPRTYEQNKTFAKLTWRLAPAWQLGQSVHYERWVNPDPPTLVTPFEVTLRRRATVPAVTFGHLTHTLSANTLWDVRVGRFGFDQTNAPSSGNLTAANHFDTVTGVSTGGPPQVGALNLSRTTVKATLTHYRRQMAGADHEWKIGGQVERGEHHSPGLIPTGVRYQDSNGRPSQAVSSRPSHVGGAFESASVFASDRVAIGDRLSVSAGVRFDYNRAISQDLPALDAEGRDTDRIVEGLGTLYTWRIVSPRAGLTMKLTGDGRTILRGSYGRFSQGVLTGELESFHPGASPVTTLAYEPETGTYSRLVSIVDSRTNLRLDPDTRAPHTHEYSIGMDRELGRRWVLATAYVRKHGLDFIGWTEVGGEYAEEERRLPDGSLLPVFVLTNAPSARRYLLTNPDGYSLSYNGLVAMIEKRRSSGWQLSASYTLSRVEGLQAASGTSAAGAQVSTVSPPQPSTFGRDPNDLTNARGRLPNDRPHLLRVRGVVDVPRTGATVAVSLQQVSGKPWASSTQVRLPQNPQQRVLLEPRGSRRLSPQTLLDLRLSRAIPLGRAGRLELLVDVLNLLNDTAEEGLATDNRYSPTFAQPTIFMDPRRAMIGVRVDLGR